MNAHRTLASLAFWTTLSTAALAQGSGFKAGELLLYSPGLQEPGYSGAGILRMDPVTGASSVLLKTPFAHSQQGVIAFDPYRQRVVVSATLALQQPNLLWFVDGLGNLQEALPQLGAASYSNIAPAGNGRIYFQVGGSGVSPLSYLDANDVLQTLYNSDGVTPLLPAGDLANPSGMIYESATNALFIAFFQQTAAFPGEHIRVRKVPLSADGSKVGGPMVDSLFNVSPGLGGEQPTGWSHGPGGKLILNVITAEVGSMPRILQVDPATAAITPWAYTDTSDPSTPPYLFATGAYSASLGKTVIVDAWHKLLRAFSQGAAGGLGSTVPIGPAAFPGVGIQVNLTSVPSDGTASTSYCTAKTTTLPGCLASIKSTGVPLQSNPGGFHVIAAPAPGGNPGIFLWSLAGAASTPFGGGWLCVQAPFKRGAALAGQGQNGQCNGIYQMGGAGFGNSWFTGAQVFTQCWFRDPGNQLASALSNALTFTVQ